MAKYIPLDALVAEIESYKNSFCDRNGYLEDRETNGLAYDTLCELEASIDTLEVKEVDEQKERMNECPFRQVGCAMYEGYILECKGACNWVVDYLKLKELKAQKGE